jgi:hypothetical protein
MAIKYLDIKKGTTAPQDANSLLAELETKVQMLAPEATWWLHVEQSDGYLVGRRDPGAKFILEGTTTLSPAQVFEGRAFSDNIEIRFAANENRGVDWWEYHFQPDDAGKPDDADKNDPLYPHLYEVLTTTPKSMAAKRSDLKPTDKGFTKVTQANGQSAIIPLPKDVVAEGPRLRIRQFFDADPDTGRVWVALETLAGYHPAIPQPTAATEGMTDEPE